MAYPVRARRRGVDQRGRIANDEAPSLSLPERSVQNHVQPAHGGWTAAQSAEPRICGLEVVGSELDEAQAAELRGKVGVKRESVVSQSGAANRAGDPLQPSIEIGAHGFTVPR